jgi:hypothetical protein
VTKLRVIFVDGKNVTKGAQAIRLLCQAVRKRVLDASWPLGFETFPTERKLSFLGGLLSDKSKLILIRELKHTRKNKSKYVQTLTSLLENNPQDVQPGGRPIAEAENGNRIQWVDAVGALGLPPNIAAEPARPGDPAIRARQARENRLRQRVVFRHPRQQQLPPEAR